MGTIGLDDLLHGGLLAHIVRELDTTILIVLGHDVPARKEEGERQGVVVLVVQLVLGQTVVLQLVQCLEILREVLVFDVVLVLFTVLAAERRKKEIGEIACRSAGVGQLPVDDLHLHLAVVAGLEHQVVEVEVTVL